MFRRSRTLCATLALIAASAAPGIAAPQTPPGQTPRWRIHTDTPPHLDAVLARGYASPSVVPQQDTTRPPVPALPNLPTDSTFTVEAPGQSRAELLCFRNIVGIIFDDTTSGASIHQLLARYRGRIIGGVPGVPEYFVQIPDPGTAFAAIDSVASRIDAEPGVRLVYVPTWRGLIRIR